MCTEHGIPFRPVAADDHCHSTVHTASRKFILRIDVRLELVRTLDVTADDCDSDREGSRIRITYGGDEFAPGERDTIERRFREDVEAYWDRVLKLVPAHGGGQPLDCCIEIQFIHDDQTTPHLRAEIIKRPQPAVLYRDDPAPWPHQDGPAFRPSCGARSNPVERDMALSWDGEGWDFWAWRRLATTYSGARQPQDVRSSGQVVLPVHHNALAHEFGHYLGAEHTCYISNPTGGWCDNPLPPLPEGAAADRWLHLDDQPPLNDYCEGSGDPAGLFSLMGSGDVVRVEDGVIFEKRLRKHHHFECENHYVVELMTDGREGVRRSMPGINARLNARRR